MRRLFFLTVIALMFFACSRVKQKAKETINKGGQMIGESASEFFDGVADGVTEKFHCEIVVSDNLKNKGIKTGKYSVENDSLGNLDNQLSLYIIFEKDFKSSITAKVFDKNGVEIGRSIKKIESKSGDAEYFSFTFNEKAYIETQSKIVIE